MEFDPKLLRLSLSNDNRHLIIRSAADPNASLEYSFGIEEEYFLADATNLEVAVTTPNALFEAANFSTGGLAMREMLQAQLEVVTNVHLDMRDAREELKFLRLEVASIAAQFGLAIMASGTHPSAVWRLSQPSPKLRYQEMIEDLRTLGHRNMLCGMHVHVQLPDASRRFGVMRGIIPYIPLFVALSTSSPFWNSQITGLKGYRLAAYDELPRTGLPEIFESEEQYYNYIEALTGSGVMADESYVWWAMRPSSRHPTLELRAPDVCTSIDDSLAMVALYRSLARHLYNRPALSLRVDTVQRAIAVENKWRAQRYGTGCIFASKDGPLPIGELLNMVIEQVAGDAAALGCEEDLMHTRTILERGSSADFQLQTYEESNGSIVAVNRWIASTTIGVQGTPARPSWKEAIV
jgi:carboxylate-amine ligase